MGHRRNHLFAVLAAYLVGFSSILWIDWQLAVVLASNSAFMVYLAIAASRVDQLSVDYLRHAKHIGEAPVDMIFVIALGAVAVAILALFVTTGQKDSYSPVWLVLAMLSVPLGWATIHTMAAFHYAHLYWRSRHDDKKGVGLQFPGEEEPDGWDFVYFAFVIGVAAQTSDVVITGRTTRRFVLAHSIVAYFFNTVLIAATVNVVVAI